jgi:hypothetical protein
VEEAVREVERRMGELLNRAHHEFQRRSLNSHSY